jgi:hypothetical protein
MLDTPSSIIGVIVMRIYKANSLWVCAPTPFENYTHSRLPNKYRRCWGTRKIRNTTLTQVTVLNTFNSIVRAQRDWNPPCK